MKTIFHTLVFLILLAASSPAAEPVELFYKFEKGESLTYALHVSQRLEASSSSDPAVVTRSESGFSAKYYQRTIDLEQGGARVELGFTKLEAWQRLGGHKLPGGPNSGLAAFSLQARLSPRGLLSDVKPAGTVQTAAQLALADQVHKALEQNLFVLPQAPVSIGGSWTTTKRLPAAVPGAKGLFMEVATTATLVKIVPLGDESQAHLDLVTKLSLAGRAKVMGAPLQLKLEGTGKGKVVFSVSRGRLIRSEQSLAITGSITNPKGGGSSRYTLELSTRTGLSKP
jgi:hypothetical protein